MKFPLLSRVVFLATLVVAFQSTVVLAVPAPELNRLWYDKPAAKWEEALPVGNGRLGAMVFGGLATERLQLNEGTLWAGGPYDPVNPEARAARPEARRRARRC